MVLVECEVPGLASCSVVWTRLTMPLPPRPSQPLPPPPPLPPGHAPSCGSQAYHGGISEKIIMANAAAMKSTGLLDAGYSQYNIGEFGGLTDSLRSVSMTYVFTAARLLSVTGYYTGRKRPPAQLPHATHLPPSPTHHLNLLHHRFCYLIFHL